MLRWVVGVVALLAVGCAGTGDLEQRVAALEVRSQAIVIERAAETTPDGDEWWLVDRSRISEVRGIVHAAVSGDAAWSARLRLQVADAAMGQTYDVAVSLTCFDLVRVGDPWPSEHEECR